ncbi:MBL fold metallo-hydrolase [Pseudoxanthomonas sp. CF125]|uniref:MBL fold metallo-hydrolase n=1 Tax=Pseudoxanthomonas sp. CF125 TaxID=1855303 RepID=UPI0008866543|nr:MBL fold metallo-hydrolase [Pseudoxanthomonas sp. CF125]SDQ57447.1 Glyoxylase, beta-lactamase superfamily II [Pseudoxanthomonas sp. CF125]
MRPAVHPLHHADTGTWSYVVADPATRAAAIIDPVLDFDAKSARVAHVSAQKLLNIVQQHGYDVRWLLETHAHADHLSAADWLKQRLPAATLAIGAGIREVQKTFAPKLDPDGALDTDGSQFDRLFGDDDRFEVGTLQARTIPVPGHTRDSLAYLIGDALFTGDSLFMPDAGTARCDFPGGDAATLYRSIRRLYDGLPDDTRVFVCHDYGPGSREAACETTIGEQRRSNIHVRDGVDENAFVTLRKARDATLAMPALILPSLQVNLRGGALPEPEGNGVRYLRIPLDSL